MIKWSALTVSLALGVPTGMLAEPFVILSSEESYETYEIDQGHMNAAVLECWDALDLYAIDPLSCRSDAISACKIEEPSLNQFRMRDVACISAAQIAWDGLLADQRTHVTNEFGRLDNEEALVGNAMPYRTPALPAVFEAWDAHRAAECNLVARRFRLGTYSSVFAMSCNLDMTIERAIQLEGYLKGF